MPTQNNIKTFFSGKQNRDNDPRVIPDGEYVRLVNGRIARSEEGGVGALENSLGNSAITTYVDATAVVLGSIRDVANNKIYYFIHGSEEDSIYEYNETEDTYMPLIRDDRTPSLLNFNVDNLITGVNIIGEGDERLLLWTDNLNPPRKINIARAKERFNGSLEDSNERRVTDEFISVVKTPPLNSPLVEEVRIPDNPLAAPNAELDPFLEGQDLDLPIEQKREKVEEIVNQIRQEENLEEKWVRFAYRWRYEDNEYSALSPFSEITFRPGNFIVNTNRGILEGMINQIKIVDISFNTGPREVTEIELVYKEDRKNEVYVVESYNKFDRNWNDNVDLSPDNIATGERAVRFSSQKLYRLLPSRELARVYDAVPLRAQSQEVIDNRVIYGNYIDQYDLIDVRKEYLDGELVTTHMDPVVVNINARRTAAEDLGLGGGDQAEEAERNANNDVLIPEGPGYLNLKSDRDYELGIVYLDDIGRQTPVLTAQENTVHIPAENSNTINRISVDIESKAPEFATGYRFFIKQTKGDFYNIFPISVPLADTTDVSGNFVWIRINDADQEKIKAGDYLNLKVTDPAGRVDTNGRELFRVDAVEAKGVNFLENTTLDPDDEIIVRQSAGIYMRLEDTRYFFAEATALQETTENNVQFSGEYHSNNSSGSPVVGRASNGTISTTIENYVEETYYYPNPNTLSEEETPSEDSIIVGGSYSPAEESGANGDEFSGAMRVEVEVRPTVSANFTGTDQTSVRIAWTYWIGTDNGIVQSSPNVVNVVPGTGDSTVDLPHGLSFGLNSVRDSSTNWDPSDYRTGDRYVFVARNASNILWGRYEDDDSKKGDDNPNTSNLRRDFTSRKSNAVLKLPEGQITQGSQLQLGVEDGFGSFDGEPISLQFDNNVFTAERDYPNVEEWFFEQGIWNPNQTGALTGAGNNPGGGGTIFEQMGFWRGYIAKERVERPFRDFFAGGEGFTERWRITQNNDTGSASYHDGNLGLIINSGTYNPGSNANSAHKRMTAQFYFSPGNIVTSGGRTRNVPYAFETQPEDGVLDIYYEIPDTFACLNGIHFGNEMSNNQKITYLNPDGSETTDPFDSNGNPLTETRTVSKITINLDYTNCVAFSNGIESSSIRDEFLGNSLEAGAKASTVSQRYRERRNVSNLIFSQPFNDQSGVNGLNDFSSSEAALQQIIKEMDITDGSIQKIFSRDTDLVVFQEDKVTKVLVNKDQLLNADGTSNITSSQRVLGQTIPYAGEFGISKNPESFAVYGNRIYFTDKNRGSVLRLAQDGLTEISNYGMRDFFRDELAHLYTVSRNGVDVQLPPIVVGAYDDYHDQYLLSLREPLVSPKESLEAQPLILSKQAFLSRTDACVFPEQDLQYTQVYEFYTPSGTAPIFNRGDIIFYDRERTSRFNGDNDWFVYFEETRVGEDDGGANPVLLEDISNDTAMYLLDTPLATTPLPGQRITVHQQENATDHNARIVAVEGNIITVVYDSGTSFTPAQEEAGAEIEFTIRYKFVIQIDRFGFVLEKLDCLNIVPPNHDAVRVSLRGFMSPQDACGKGIVARIVYHNGDDPTPDVGDSIFDTPFGDDEFIDGNYFKGRTQKRGWYKMFDGSDFEDYVINIIQGRVVEKVRCAEIDAGRIRILTSEAPIQRIPARAASGTAGTPTYIPAAPEESDVRLATRICAMLPTEENFHDGASRLPVPGDTMYADNFSNSPLRAGFYAIEGGYYVELSNTGVVRTVNPCTITICVDDVVGQALVDLQNNPINSFTFQGVGGIVAQLPEILGSAAVRGEDNGSLVFNGSITDLGEFRSLNALWYYQVGGETPTERGLVRDGIQLLAENAAGEPQVITNTGAVSTVTADNAEGNPTTNTIFGIQALTDVYNMFAIMVENIIITTDVFVTRSSRTVDPVFVSFTADNQNPSFGQDVVFTVTSTNQANDEHRYAFYKDGVLEFTTGAINEADSSATFTISNWTSLDDGVYSAQAIYSDLIQDSPNTIEVREATPIAPTLSLVTTFNTNVDGAEVVATVTDPDQPALTPHDWLWVTPGDFADISGATGGYDPPFSLENLQDEDGDTLQDEDGDNLQGFVPNP